MSTKICSNCYQINTTNSMVNYCMWCGQDLRDEDAISNTECTTEEWFDIVNTTSKIQKIKATQFIENFNKEEILADNLLLLQWWLSFCGVKVKQNRRSS